MFPLIMTLVQWEFVVTTMVIFFSVSKNIQKWHNYVTFAERSFSARQDF